MGEERLLITGKWCSGKPGLYSLYWFVWQRRQISSVKAQHLVRTQAIKTQIWTLAMGKLTEEQKWCFCTALLSWPRNLLCLLQSSVTWAGWSPLSPTTAAGQELWISCPGSLFIKEHRGSSPRSSRLLFGEGKAKEERVRTVGYINSEWTKPRKYRSLRVPGIQTPPSSPLYSHIIGRHPS